MKSKQNFSEQKTWKNFFFKIAAFSRNLCRVLLQNPRILSRNFNWKMEQQQIKVLPTPIKSSKDQKDYKCFKLPNGLTALLVSDTTYDLEKLDQEENEIEENVTEDEDEEELEDDDDDEMDSEVNLKIIM